MEWRNPIGRRPGSFNYTARRRLEFENLESRRLLAVTTALNSGTLTVTGDSAADDIAIVGTANPGEITITGRNGTTINGTPNGNATIPGVTADLILELGDGDNVLDMDNVYLAGNIGVTTGADNDRISLGATSPVSPANDLAVSSGAGNDVIFENSYHVFVGRNNILNSGTGNDSIVLGGASALGSIIAVTGEGTQNVLLDGCTAGVLIQVHAHHSGTANIAIFRSAASQYVSVSSLGAGSSLYVDTVFAGVQLALNSGGTGTTVTVARSSLGQAYITGAYNRVVIYGNSVTQGVLAVSTSLSGSEQVEMSYNVVPAGLTAYLAEGNDVLTLIGNSAEIGSFDGGPGSNQLVAAGNFFELFAPINFV